MTADIERAALIAALAKHPGWPVLAEDTQAEHDRYQDATGRAMMKTGKPFADFEFKRGFLAGQLALLKAPDAAAKTVAKHATSEEGTAR